MRDFLKNLIVGNSNVSTEKMESILRELFINPVSTEWSFRGNTCEAIFYKDNKEHIAHFDKTGKLVDYKVNLPLDTVPGTISKIAGAKGEIMNVVMIRKENEVQYEVIFRNKELSRFLLLLYSDGGIISEKRL